MCFIMERIVFFFFFFIKIIKFDIDFVSSQLKFITTKQMIMYLILLFWYSFCVWSVGDLNETSLI